MQAKIWKSLEMCQWILQKGNFQGTKLHQAPAQKNCSIIEVILKLTLNKVPLLSGAWFFVVEITLISPFMICPQIATGCKGRDDNCQPGFQCYKDRCIQMKKCQRASDCPKNHICNSATGNCVRRTWILTLSPDAIRKYQKIYHRFFLRKNRY